MLAGILTVSLAILGKFGCEIPGHASYFRKVLLQGHRAGMISSLQSLTHPTTVTTVHAHSRLLVSRLRGCSTFLQQDPPHTWAVRALRELTGDAPIDVLVLGDRLLELDDEVGARRVLQIAGGVNFDNSNEIFECAHASGIK